MKSKRNAQILGSWGEAVAVDFLEQRGYRLVASNVRSPYGEIDLIVRKDENAAEAPESVALTVFVEVKTRSSARYGYPEQAITPRKRAHLLATAQEYMRLHPELAGEWRVDVIAIMRSGKDAPPEILHFENAITAEQT